MLLQWGSGNTLTWGATELSWGAVVDAAIYGVSGGTVTGRFTVSDDVSYPEARVHMRTE